MSALKEIVMATFLKEIVVKTKRAMEIEDFSYDECVLFGGEVAGTTFASANLLLIILSSLLAFLLMKCKQKCFQHTNAFSTTSKKSNTSDTFDPLKIAESS